MPPVISATWMPGEDIEKDPLAASYTPDVAIDSAGNVLLAWREGNGVKLRRYNGTTRAWEATRTLEDRGTVDGVQVAIGGRHALVIWYLRTADAPAGTRGLWFSYSANAGVDWSPPMRVHDGPVYYDQVVAIAANGFGAHGLGGVRQQHQHAVDRALRPDRRRAGRGRHGADGLRFRPALPQAVHRRRRRRPAGLGAGRRHGPGQRLGRQLQRRHPGHAPAAGQLHHRQRQRGGRGHLRRSAARAWRSGSSATDPAPPTSMPPTGSRARAGRRRPGC